MRIAGLRGAGDACVLCRAPLEDDPDLVRACARCHARVHAACAEEMPGCPTLGCPGEPEEEDVLLAWRRAQGLPPEPPRIDARRAEAARDAARPVPARGAEFERQARAGRHLDVRDCLVFGLVALAGPLPVMLGALAHPALGVVLGLAWMIGVAGSLARVLRRPGA